MRGVQINYLFEHPEYISELAQWLFVQWGSILGEKTPEARIEKLKRHLNRDNCPSSGLRMQNGRVLGTASLCRHDLDGPRRPDSLARRSVCRLTFSASRYWGRTMRRRRGRGSDASDTHAVFVQARQQAWYSRVGWTILEPCVWQQRPGDITVQDTTNARTKRCGQRAQCAMHSMFDLRSRSAICCHLRLPKP